MRKKSFMQIGGLMGFVLLLLVISDIIIHRDAKNIKRYKRKTTDLIEQYWFFSSPPKKVTSSPNKEGKLPSHKAHKRPLPHLVQLWHEAGERYAWRRKVK